MVVKETIQSRLVCGFAIAALKVSPQYEQFKKEKIWLLGAADLQRKMQEAKFGPAMSKTNETPMYNWMMFVARIIRFEQREIDADRPSNLDYGSEQAGEVLSGKEEISHIQAVRNYLMDYVFSVSRVNFRRKYTRL